MQHHAQDGLGQYAYGYSSPTSQKSEVKTADGVTRGSYQYGWFFLWIWNDSPDSPDCESLSQLLENDNIFHLKNSWVKKGILWSKKKLENLRLKKPCLFVFLQHVLVGFYIPIIWSNWHLIKCIDSDWNLPSQVKKVFCFQNYSEHLLSE